MKNVNKFFFIAFLAFITCGAVNFADVIGNEPSKKPEKEAGISPADEKQVDATGVKQEVPGFLRLRNFFSPSQVSESLTEEHLKKDFHIIRNLDQTDHKIILYSVMHRFYLKSKDPRKIEEVLTQEFKQMEEELKKELFHAEADSFASKNGREPNQEEQQALQQSVQHEYQHCFNLHPYDKLKRIADLEAYYLTKKDTSEELNESRRFFFEWMREKTVEELQEFQLYTQKKPKKGLAKYKSLTMKALAFGALAASLYLGYRWFSLPQYKDLENMYRDNANDSACLAVFDLLAKDRAQYEKMHTKGNKEGFKWDVLMKSANDALTKKINEIVKEKSEPDKQKLANFLSYTLQSPSNLYKVIREAFFKAFGDNEIVDFFVPKNGPEN